MVVLRKRKVPHTPVASEVPPKRTVSGVKPKKDNATKKALTVSRVGEVINLSDFGGQIELHDGTKTSLKELVEESTAGVVLFTYPRASTPGCTTQACLFRDSYGPLTDKGLKIFGLSRDSAKSNANFKSKQSLPYPLVCDPSATLIEAIGFRNGDKTQRGVFVVDKQGKVLVSEPGGPAATLQAVQGILDHLDGNGEKA